MNAYHLPRQHGFCAISERQAIQVFDYPPNIDSDVCRIRILVMPDERGQLRHPMLRDLNVARFKHIMRLILRDQRVGRPQFLCFIAFPRRSLPSPMR